MNIRKEQNGSELYIALEGSLNTLTSPLLEKELAGALDDITLLVFDFSKLEYISSSGLRILFGAQLTLDGRGEVHIKNSNETVREIIEITGCASVLKVD